MLNTIKFMVLCCQRRRWIRLWSCIPVNIFWSLLETGGLKKTLKLEFQSYVFDDVRNKLHVISARSTVTSNHLTVAMKIFSMFRGLNTSTIGLYNSQVNRLKHIPEVLGNVARWRLCYTNEQQRETSYSNEQPKDTGKWQKSLSKSRAWRWWRRKFVVVCYPIRTNFSIRVL